MSEKILNTRIINKHDEEEDWLKATNFIPNKGELIIYDVDSTHSYERIKVGDGTTVVNSLPFVDDTKVDKISGKGLSTNDYTTTEKNKLSGIASGAEVNQNAFSNVIVGSTTIAADSKTDSLTLVAGSNITLTPDATNDKVTIAAKDTVYTHPSYTARTGVPTENAAPAFGGTFNVSQPVSDATGHITAINSRTVTIPNTTATTNAAGLMSAADKTKLNGIATGANKTTVDGSLSSTSTNPVQNKVVNTAITNLKNLVGDTSVSTQITNAITSQKGATSGIAELDSNGKVPSAQLPSYVDDVLEYNGKNNFPSTGESGKIYVDTTTNKTYRWSGSAYVEISPSLALGTTSSTAFRGDYGNTAYTHATAKGSAFSSGLYKITTNAQGHVTAATAVTKSDITGLGIPEQDTIYSDATTSKAGLMSASDKSKLDGIASGANKTTVDSALSSTSTNPVQNKVVNTAITNLNTLVGDTSVSEQISDAISNKVDTVNVFGSGNAITSASRSGPVLTLTKDSTFLTKHPTISQLPNSTSTESPHHGSTFTAVGDITRDSNGHVKEVHMKTIRLPTDINTDTKVTQTATTSNATYPLLLAPSGQTATATTTSYFDSGVTLNPSTNTIAANISGNAATATKATKDESGNTITSTYATKSDLSAVSTLVGDTPVSDQISTAIEAKITPTILEENSDLDNLTTAGLYAQAQITKAQTIVNNPLKTDDTGILVKVYNTNNDSIYQELHGIKSGGIYKRRYSSGKWTGWIEIATVYSTVAKANKLATDHTIAISGGATGTATSFDGSSNITIPVTSMKPEYLSEGYVKNRLFLNTSVNNNGVVIPYAFNDIAHLLKKGGSAIVYYDDTQASTNISAVFNSDFDYWSKSTSDITKIVFELTLDKTYTNINTVYIDSGNSGYRAKDIKIEVMDSNYANDTWTTKLDKTNNEYSYLMTRFSHTPNGASSKSFNKMRITFSNWASSSFRIACIGLLATIGSKALTEVCLSKAGGNIYGSITPYANASYNLGSSTNKFSAVYANTFSGTASYAVRDTNGDQIDTTYVKQSGSTMSNLNSLLASATSTGNITPNSQAVASSPFARDLWHDHFAFLSSGYSLQNNQTTKNNSTWTDSTTNLEGLFQQKDKIAVQILDASTLARRFTLYNTQLSYSSIEWYEIGVAYSNPSSKFEVHIETSNDNSTWTTIHKSTITSNSKPYFLKGDSVGSNKYLRFTFTKTSNTTTGLVSLTCLKGFTMRKGNQGLGIENEYPYDWDADRNIYPHNDNVRSLGTSSLRWASVYATNFVGTASKATSDANGNNIVNTYAKKPVITTVTISVPTTGWTKNSTYGAYTQVFTATGATTDADLYIDCPVGSKFPLVGARCLESNKITLYMSDIPTVSQSITVKIKKEG